MKNVEELRKNGFKVKVCHRRLYVTNELDYRVLLLSRFERDELTYDTKIDLIGPLELGGESSVLITTPDGTNIEGMSVCSDQEHFNRRKGLQIALGRALNQLGV
jgi:hypothetical protein